MSLHALPYDAWATIGYFLSPGSLLNASAACQHTHDLIWDNEVLWSLQAACRWKSCSNLGIVDDWKGLYRSGHLAACRLSTTEPWCASLPSCPGQETPLAAQLLIKHSSNGYQPPPSAIDPINSTSSRPAAAFLSPPDVIAASIDQQLHFWVWDTPPPDAGGCAEDGLSDPLRGLSAGLGRAVSGGAQHYCSHPQYSHTATIDTLVELPTSGGAIGVATGARDRTVKLWAPFQDGTTERCGSGEAGLVRPLRTLRGHTGRITSLAAIRTVSGEGSGSGNSGSSSHFSVLASASTDTTIRLWDVSVLQQLPPPADAALACNSSSSRVRQVRDISASGAAVGRRGRRHNHLLATLRGHGDAVMSLLRWDGSGDCSSGSGSASTVVDYGLLSTGRDSRLKLWDVAEGRSACVATWRLPEEGMKVFDALHLPGCVAVMMPGSLQVLDVRMQESGSSTSQGVVTLPWHNCHLAAAAGYGSTVAAGGCKGVRAWDVRVCSSNTASANNNSKGSGHGRELFSSHMPNREPVKFLHLDRVELVGATNTSALHSPASIAVWSMPGGQRVQLLSSTLACFVLWFAHSHMHCISDSAFPWP